MRYTRIGFASYAIAAVLVVAVVGVAWTRSRSVASPVPSSSSAPTEPSATEPQESGEAAYQAECAGCHGDGERRRNIPALRGYAVELYASEGGREYLVDFMLTGRVRILEDGRVVYEEAHPGYPQLSDARIAAILNHMLTSWGNDLLPPAGRRPYGAPEIAARR